MSRIFDDHLWSRSLIADDGTFGDPPAFPEIKLLSDADVPGDCALFGIWLGNRCIGCIVIGPDGEELLTANLDEALAFAARVTRERRPGR